MLQTCIGLRQPNRCIYRNNIEQPNKVLKKLTIKEIIL